MDTTICLTDIDLNAVRYDKGTGLVPVVVQDEATGAVLTLAYANREALKRTFGTGQAWFWSRSRSCYWRKGETSGNVQRVVDVRLDCDGDAVLYLVQPVGPACHTGAYSCFHQRVRYQSSAVSDGKTSVGSRGSDGQDAAATAGTSLTTDNDRTAEAHAKVLSLLWDIVSDRWQTRPQGSYTTFLFEHGVDKIAKKVGEESVEVVIAAKNAVASGQGQRELVSESADLLFHLMTLWRAVGVSPGEVYAELRARHR